MVMKTMIFHLSSHLSNEIGEIFNYINCMLSVEKELLGGLKDLEGSGLQIRSQIEDNFPPEDSDASSLSSELKELLSRLVVLMAQTEKLNRATKVTDENGSVKSDTSASSTRSVNLPQPPSSSPFTFAPSPKINNIDSNLLSSPPHLHVDDENGRRSPEGSAAASNSPPVIMKNPTGKGFLEVTGGTNNNHGGVNNFLTHQCGCCGAPIMISVVCPQISPDHLQQLYQQQSQRDNFYRIPNPTTPTTQQNNVFH